MERADGAEPFKPTPNSQSPDSYGGVSPGWRVAAVVLAVLVIVVAALPFALSRETTVTQSEVVWHEYTLYGGPEAGALNSTDVAPGTFCPQHTPSSMAFLSVSWGVESANAQLNDFQWWASNTSPGGQPKGEPGLVFSQKNSSAGGTVDLDPFDVCSYLWILAVEATVSITVDVTITLEYNYSTTVTTSPYP
jgi:hypothetical protein